MAYRGARGQPMNNYDNGGFFMEQQNDDMVDDLAHKVSTLKRVTIAIGDDVREQNKLLNEMDTGFDLSRGLLGSTMKKLGLVSNNKGKNVLCWLVLFSFFVFLVIYYCARLTMTKEADEDVYAIFVPDSPDKYTFKDFKEVKSFLDSPLGKKQGTRFKRCATNDELDDFYNQSKQSEGNSLCSTPPVNEPISPYRSVPTSCLSQLRQAIEKKDDQTFDALLAENPRFLVNTSNDLPTIIHEGFRYNALHVSCRSSNMYAVDKIMRLITDFNWLIDAFGTDMHVADRSKNLQEAFINTPDLGEYNVPLHYACKFGSTGIVRILVGNRYCKKSPVNKYKESPMDLVCRRYTGSDIEEVRTEISGLIEGKRTPARAKSTPQTPSTSNDQAPTAEDSDTPKRISKMKLVQINLNKKSPMSELAEKMENGLKISDNSDNESDKSIYEDALDEDPEEHEETNEADGSFFSKRCNII
ncbi:ankyrin repeat and LEM domain-containing protein 2 like protein [Ditylenchus destructor]|uniref:Ankyrin repeat and LEM domain-containing protein 2 like protein n=1 Tax=Ditylenchus destructor TaxID=166010 RepID=A0AAD4N3Y9_9BILA|nr:ankyrin repeat and LEM domain-containing protein 2 like protein [Ditylenchus destructor]